MKVCLHMHVKRVHIIPPRLKLLAHGVVEGALDADRPDRYPSPCELQAVLVGGVAGLLSRVSIAFIIVMKLHLNWKCVLAGWLTIIIHICISRVVWIRRRGLFALELLLYFLVVHPTQLLAELIASCEHFFELLQSSSMCRLGAKQGANEFHSVKRSYISSA